MAELRISKLPDRTPIKLTIAILPELNNALTHYATIYAETYGQADPVVELIPSMLTSFLESDRGFQRSLASKPKRSG
jgi:hypothetical protein